MTIQSLERQSPELYLRLYTRTEAAKIMGISKGIMTQLITDGKIGTITINGRDRISFQEISRFISESIRYNQKQKNKPEDNIDRFISSQHKRKTKEIITDEYFHNLLREAA